MLTIFSRPNALAFGSSSCPRPQRTGWRSLVALYRSRRALAQLTPSQLDDIGIAKADAIRESDRPLWDVPDHWLR